MGKVIKGSTVSEERYTVTIPAFAGVAPPRTLDDAPGDSLEPFATPAAPVAPPEPSIDFAAIEAEAQALIDEATRTATALIEDAQRRASALTNAAVERAAAHTDEAFRQGHVDGYAAGALEAQTATSGMIDVMRGLIDAVRAERHVLLGSAEPELVRLAVGIAERVLHQQIALDHGVVVEMARAAIARIVDRETITVRVNPADIEQMRGHRDELLALGDVKTMRVIEDQRVDRGGVILETDAGSIDAKISTQLAEVRKILHINDDVVVGPADTSADGPADELALGAARAS
jgi:flagellar biosynthesis/type III secretory pathway protein FliH